MPRPDFLDSRDNWWRRGDRTSWDLTAIEEAPVLQQLMEARKPISVGEWLVHGDLLGNVLYGAGSAARDHRLGALLASDLRGRGRGGGRRAVLARCR